MVFGKENRTREARLDSSPIRGDSPSSGVTFSGACDDVWDAKFELFLLSIGDFFKGNFYESGEKSVEQFIGLVHGVAVTDPGWTAQFISWLRHKEDMRSLAVVAGLEAARAVMRAEHAADGTSKQSGWPRRLAASGVTRLDEIGKAVAYWADRYGSRNGGHGTILPKPIKRALADKMTQLTTEYAVAKYDSPSKGFRLADLLNLLHPKPLTSQQSDLFAWLIANTLLGPTPAPDSLPLLKARAALVCQVGMTWEAMADCAMVA